MNRTLRRALYYLLHLIGFGLLYLVLKDLDWSGFSRLFSSFNLLPFLAGFLMLVITYLLKAYRYMLINRSFNIHLSYGNTLSFFLVAGFLSVITPGRLGEFSKIYFVVKKTGVGSATASSAVVLDRIWDVLILTLMGGLSFIVLLGGFHIKGFTLAIIVLLFLASLSVVVFPGLIFRPVLWILKKRSAFRSDVEVAYANWREKAKRMFLPGFMLTLVAFLVLSTIPLYFSHQLSQQVGYLPSLSAVSISNMLGFLPVTVAGFGTRELVFSEIWSMLERPAEVAITISTAYFICNHLGSILLGGLTYLFRFRKEFKISRSTNFQI